MRWFWIDRFTSFESGRSASAVKNVTLSEEALDNYTPGRPNLPYALIIEGMAQTAGLLVAEVNSFQDRVVLAKVGKAIFHMPARNGDQLRFSVQIDDRRDDGAIVSGTTHIGDKLQGEIELTFAFLSDRFGSKALFPNNELLGMLVTLGLFEVGVDSHGKPLTIPPHLLVAEDTADST
jgi:3-hydroxyacyl-[acyl-carrier-protein] dehydratase